VRNATRFWATGHHHPFCLKAPWRSTALVVSAASTIKVSGLDVLAQPRAALSVLHLVTLNRRVESNN
jgi:hypothetical protein